MINEPPQMIDSRDQNDWEHQLIKFIPKESADAVQTEITETKADEDGNRKAQRELCHNHSDIEATFKCSGCGRLFCEECAQEKNLSGEWFRFCSECGGVCSSLEELEETPDISGNDEVIEGGKKRKKTPARILTPEPPPVDRQLMSILTLPFKGFGVTVVLAWSIWLFLTWPFGLVLLVPYLVELYAKIEEGNKRVPGPWRLGGGSGHVVRTLSKIVVSPILPLTVCYVLVFPKSSGTTFPILGDTAALAIQSAQPWSLGVVAVILLFVPLMVVVLFRTGSPFISLDFIVLSGLIRRSFQRYMSLLISMLMIVGVSFGLYLLMLLAPFGGTSFKWVPLIIPPTVAAAVAALFCSFWLTISMAVFGHWLGWSLGEESELDLEN